MSRVIWTLPAQNDLVAIDDYYADVDTAFADRVGRTAIAGARFLAEQSAAGAEIASNVRRWRVAKTPYLLFDRILPEGVEILRVQHDRRDRPMP